MISSIDLLNYFVNCLLAYQGSTLSLSYDGIPRVASHWASGNFNRGVWDYGYYSNGTWKGGVWIDGVFDSGNFGGE